MRWILCASLLLALASSASATSISVSDPSGLSADVTFELVNPTTLKVTTKNTSVGVPGGFSNADQILTSVAWDFGGITSITGGSVKTGPSSASINFSVTNVGANADVSGEYGYGNGGTTGLTPNYISGNTAGITPFGGANLDGPGGLNGPQGGLVASPILVPIGGLGAISNEWVATLSLSNPIASLDFLSTGITVEYGSDAAFVHGTPTSSGVPEPSTALLGFGAAAMLFAARRRRSFCRKQSAQR